MRIQTVLCPVDFGPLSDRHLQLAINVCRRFGARLVVEHNVGASPPYFMGVSWMWSEGHELPDQHQAEEASAHLKRLLDTLPADLSPTGKLSRGPLDTALLIAAEEVEADLIVIGSQGWGGVDHHSVTEELVARASCPVLGVDERSVATAFFSGAGPAPDRPARVLVPLDLGEASLAAVEQAVALSKDFPMKLTFLHVAPARQHATGSEASIERAAKRQADLEGRIRAMLPEGAPEFACISIPGKPCEDIVKMAGQTEADLIVMGGHHAGIFRHLFTPPTSCSVLHESGCPVWFVPIAAQSFEERHHLQDVTAA